MLNPLHVFRRPAAPGAYSPDEILTILRGKDESERAREALELIASPNVWLPPDTNRTFGNLAWHAERLPLIFHLYRRGWAAEQIGRKLSPLGGAWAVENTLRLAASLIAARLNDRLLAA